jgi:putative transcriptional regulator
LRNSIKLNKLVLMNRIKEVLKEQGRTQTWLAEKIEKSYVVVTNYCNNNTQPSIQVLTEISLFLDVDIRELLVSTKNDLQNG